MLLQMALFHSVLWLCSVPLYLCTTSLSSPLSVDTSVVSDFCEKCCFKIQVMYVHKI